MADVKPPKKLKDPTSPYSNYNNQDRILNTYIRYMAVGGLNKLLASEIGMPNLDLVPNWKNNATYLFDSRTSLISQLNWATTALVSVGYAANNSSFGSADNFKFTTAEVGLARSAFAAGLETMLAVANVYRWAPSMNPTSKEALTVMSIEGDGQGGVKTTTKWQRDSANTKNTRNYLGAAASAGFVASGIVGLGFSAKQMQIMLGNNPTPRDVAAAGLGIASASASIVLNSFKGLSSLGNARGWSVTFNNRMAIAGTAVGVAQVGLNMGQLIAAMTNPNLSDEERGVLGAEMGGQILGGITQLLAASAMATRVAQGASLAGPALGMALGALVLAISPVQIYGLVKQSEYADKLEELGREMSQYGYDGDSALGQFYHDKTDLEGGLLAATTTLALVGTAVSIAAACSVVGAPVAAIVALATAIVSGILTAVQQPMIEAMARKYAEKINAAGGPEIYFGKDMEAHYNQFITSEDTVKYLTDLQKDMGVDSVIGVTTVGISQTALNLASLTKNSDQIKTQSSYVNRFINGEVVPDQTLLLNTTTGQMSLGGATGSSQLLTFLTPLAAPGVEKRTTVSTGKNSSSTTLDVLLATGGWRIDDGDANSTLDIRSVVTRVYSDDLKTLQGEVALTVNGGKGDDMVIMGNAQTTYDGGAGNNTVSYGGLSHAKKLDDGSTLIDNWGTIVVTPTSTGFRVEKTLHNPDIYTEKVTSSTQTSGKRTEDVQYREITLTKLPESANTMVVVDTLTNVANIYGTSSGDNITGDGNDNMIAGGGGLDTINGGAGNDRLVQTGAIGWSLIDGGTGTDTLDYSSASSNLGTRTLALTGAPGNLTFTGVGVDMSAGKAYSVQSYDRFSAIENVVGTSRNDVLSGDVNANALLGSGGNDTIFGGGGSDYLSGGAGNDSIDGGADDDVIVQEVDSAVDTLVGGSGSDMLDYGQSPAVNGVVVDLGLGLAIKNASGVKQNDSYDTLSGIENVTGTDKNDRLTGDANANVLIGGFGNDSLSGGAGDDNLLGGVGADTLRGGTGDDRLTAGGLAATMRGRYLMVWRPPANNGDTAGNVLNLSELQIFDANGNDIALGKPVSHSSNVKIFGGDGIMSLLVDGVVNTSGTDDYKHVQTHVTDNNGSAYRATIAPAGTWIMVDLGASMDISSVVLYGNERDGGALNQNLTMILTDMSPDDASLAGKTLAQQYDLLTASQSNRVYRSAASTSARLAWSGTPSLSGQSDVYDGGDGYDTVDYSQSVEALRLANGRGVSIDLATGTVDAWYAAGTATSAYSDVLTSVESAVGTAQADRLVGNAVANVLQGGDGNDTITGGAGDDVLQGGGGNDSMDGGDGADMIYAGTGADTVIGGAGDDYVMVDDYQAGAGVSTFSGGTGENMLDFSQSSLYDRVKDDVGVNVDLAAGTAKGWAKVGGSAVLTANISGFQEVRGSLASDVLTGDAADNVLDGRSGKDLLNGGDGNDVLLGGAGADTVNGGAGDDQIIQDIEACIDVLDGGSGSNTLDYSATMLNATERGALNGKAGGSAAADATGLNINLNTGRVQKFATGAGGYYDQISNFTNVIGSSLNDTIIGDAQDNVMDGGNGNDSIEGGAGSDLLGGGAGADTLRGGAGDDVLAGGDLPPSAVLHGRYVMIWRPPAANGDTAGNVINLSELQVFDFSGNNVALNKAVTHSSNVYIFGGEPIKAELVDGQINTEGKNDNQRLQTHKTTGTQSSDWVVAPSGSWVMVDLGKEVDISAVNLLGNSDTTLNQNLVMFLTNTDPSARDYNALIGDAAVARYQTETDGRASQGWSASFNPAQEADLFDGGDGTDTLDYSQSSMTARLLEGRGVNVSLASGSANSWYAPGHTAGASDTIVNVENVIGSVANDILTGNAGANVLDGGIGNDTVDGGAGDDYVSGGSGVDSVSGGDGDDMLRAGDMSGSAILHGRYVYAVISAVNGGSSSGNDILGQTELRIYDAKGNNVAQGKNVQRLSYSQVLIDLGSEMDLSCITLAGIGGAAINRSVSLFVSNTSMFATSANTSMRTEADLLADRSVAHYQTAADQRSVQNWTAAINATLEADRYDGGAGLDTLDYSRSSELSRMLEGRGVNVNLATNTFNSWYAAGHTADAINDIVVGVENVVGSVGNDILIGDANGNDLEGSLGNDSISGAGGSDTLSGGSGMDTMAGGDGDDFLVAGNSHTASTTLYGRYVMIWRPPANNGNVAANVINLSELQVYDMDGNNVAKGKTVTHSTNVNIYGFDGMMSKLVDGIINTAGANDFQRLQTHITNNNDTTDTVIAPSGSWVMVDLGAAMDISGINLFGNDTASLNQNLAMFVTTADPSARTYASLSGDNTVARYLSESDGRAAQTWMMASNTSTESDRYEGGDGSDTLDYSQSSLLVRSMEGRGVNVNLAAGTANQWYRAGHTDGVTDTFTSIENAIGTLAADVLTGDGNANLLSGAGGNDSLSGGGGNDTLAGGYGADTVSGGDGDDLLVAGETPSAANTLHGRYVMIWRPPANNGNVAANVLNLSELKVFDANGNNVALNKSVSHSSNVNIYGFDVMMGKLVDGAVNTAGANDFQRLQTHVTNNNSTTDTVIAPSGSWVMVDLGAVMDISAIVLSGNDSAALNQNLAMFLTSTDPSARSYASLTGDNTVARYLSENDGRATQVWTAGINLSAEGDIYDGGAGLDTLDYSQSAIMQRALEGRGVAVDLGQGKANQWYRAGHTADSVTDTLSGIENLIGTLQDDVLSADANVNVLTGGAGNDVLNGGAGGDTYVFNVGDGNDTVVESGSSAQTDTIRFGAGIASKDVTLELVGSNIVVRYGSGDLITITAWTLGGDGTGENRAIERFVFDDGTIWDAVAINNRVVKVAATVNGTEGNDSMSGTEYADKLSGLGGNDTLVGGNGNDTLTGGNGNDYLDGGAGEDSMIGGLGDDTYVVDLGQRGDVGWDWIVEDADSGNDTVASWINWTIRNVNIENLTLYGTLDNYATGNAGNNVIRGNTGSNTLTGLEGDDTMIGNGGSDIFEGGTGNDSMTGGSGADTYLFNLGDGKDVIVESGANTATDVLKFGTGIVAADLVLQWSGNDLVISLPNGTDRITVQGWLASDNAKIEQFAFADGTVWNAATIQSKLAMTINGTSGADVLTATSQSTSMYGLDGNDKLTGGAGNDTLDGGAGGDTLIGGLGNDTYVVDSGSDTITENANAGTDTVVASLTWTIANVNLENLTLSGSSAISGTGNAGNNVLQGNSANNTLTGLAGNDTLYGNDGNDSLLGGEGNDLEYGGNGNDSVFGGAGNDSLFGGDGNDVLGAGAGTDVLNGGVGNDTYQFNVGDGTDVVTDHDTTAGNSDVIQIGEGVAIDQLWFSRADNDLRIDIVGKSDRLTVANWFVGSAEHIELIKNSYGRSLTDSGVAALVQAMAGFSPPAAGTASIPTSNTTVTAALAANWQ